MTRRRWVLFRATSRQSAVNRIEQIKQQDFQLSCRPHCPAPSQLGAPQIFLWVKPAQTVGLGWK